MRSLLLFLFLVFSGCGKRVELTQDAGFRDLAFPAFSEQVPEGSQKAKVYPAISIIADQMAFSDLVALIVRESGLSISYAEGLDTRLISITALAQPVDQILATVARRLGVQVALQGTIWYLGDLRPEDRSTLVTFVGGLDQKSLDEILRVQTSENGRYFCNNSGLCVIADRAEIIARIAVVLDQVRQMRPGTWVVQLAVISLTERERIELGLSVEHVANVAAVVAGGVRSADISTIVAGKFDAVLRAARDKGNAGLRVAPLFLVEPGFRAEYSDGQVVPVPRRVVSDQGTVTTVGYDNVPTGASFTVLVREMGLAAAVLEVEAELSEIVSYVESAPVTQRARFSTRCTVERGGVFLLGEFERQRQSVGVEGPLIPLFGQTEQVAERMTLWARVIRL